jgi:hypothetical protein
VFGNKDQDNKSDPVGSGGSGGSGGSLDQVLNETRAWFKRFVYTTDDKDLDVIALWTIHTWLCEETYTTPRLLIDSPVPGSGKTTLLEHLGKLCFSPVQMAAVSSSAMLARITNDGIRTLLLDEADRSLDPRDPKTKDLIAILNSGYKKGGSRPVLVKVKDNYVVVEMPTYSPVAIAGNTPLLPDDTRSRCITIRLLPARDELIEPSDWEFLDQEIEALRDKISATTDKIRDQIKLVDPQLPEGCANRLRERWRPLKRIAIVANEHWAYKTDQLILRDIENERELSENGEAYVSTNLQIARDLYKVFDTGQDAIPTSQIVKSLIKISPEHWSSLSHYGKDLTVQRFGRIISGAYGISSLRLSENSRGYRSTQFSNTWNRLGISPKKPTEPTEPTEPTALPPVDESELF